MLWYLDAAKKEDANAMSSIGTLYAKGLGVKREPERAIQWYSKASKNGLPFALCKIGDIYKNGLGVPKDSVKAQHWYDKCKEAQTQAAKSSEKPVAL